MSIFTRKRRLNENVTRARIETALAQQRLEIAQETVAVPHQRLREDNHFAQIVVQSLIEGYGNHR